MKAIILALLFAGASAMTLEEVKVSDESRKIIDGAVKDVLKVSKVCDEPAKKVVHHHHVVHSYSAPTQVVHHVHHSVP